MIYLSFLISENVLMPQPTSFLELDHREIVYRKTSLSLAWQGAEESSNCSISKLQSFPQCELNNIDLNISTTDTTYTISSEKLYTSQELADLNLTVISEPPGMLCPNLSRNGAEYTTLRFNSKNTCILK